MRRKTIYEYRVSYRRANWSPSSSDRSRLFARYADAARFADRLLHATQPPGSRRLGPVEVTLSRRQVLTAWEVLP